MREKHRGSLTGVEPSFVDALNSTSGPMRRRRGGDRASRPLALVVDADPFLSKVLCFMLEQNEFRCSTAATGASALASVGKNRPDVVFLDLLLPDMDGFEVVAKIRKVSTVPIMVIKGLPETRHKVKALGLGADEYLPKPLDYGELVAQTKALMRRASANGVGSREGVLQIGDLRVDLERRRIWREYVGLELGATHWRLLYNLLVRRGRIVTYGELQESVWPGAHHGLGYLRQWVSRVRRTIGDTDGSIIRNVPGHGYSIESNGQ